jgi:hypothetical protein
MKLKNLLCSIVIGMIATANINAQVTVSSNNGASGDYVGWASGNNFDLTVAHKGAYNINFLTNNTQYMRLLGSGNTGYLGIGTSYSPSYKLDVDGDVNAGGTSTSM